MAHFTDDVFFHSADLKPAKTLNGKGWVIMGRDPSKYGGNYWAPVGWASKAGQGFIAFKLKREAQAAIDKFNA